MVGFKDDGPASSAHVGETSESREIFTIKVYENVNYANRGK
jgi:hypothetical protein